MATAAVIAGGTIASSVIGANAAEDAANTSARAAKKAGAIRSQAFTEGGDVEAAGIRQGAGISANALDSAGASLQPFAVGGAEAAQLEAALSGALGLEAQQRAMDAQVQSPFQKFIEESGRRQIGQGFAATGGLGGSERLKALTKFGQQTASGTLTQQLQNLRNVRQSGSNMQLNIADIISRAGGVRGAGETGAQTALAQAIRGAGGATATGVGQAGAAKAAGQQAVGNIASTAVGDLSSIIGLNNQGLFDKPKTGVR
ncbi:hypothetical protein KAR91_82410 [Candidatus Pacearchaeota archaeon]|nr:hypothetical protein [Candidatus Pacearchaeota archaeon]